MIRISLGKKLSDSVCITKIHAPSPTRPTPASVFPPAQTPAQIPTTALTSAKS